MENLERNACLSGIGLSTVGRRLGRSGLDLTLEAIDRALEDSGLTAADIDGLSCWPGQQATPVGMSPVSIFELRDALNLKLNWYAGGAEGPAQLSSILNACMAVATGQARHVLCFRTLTESTAAALGHGASRTGQVGQRIAGMFQWQIPFNAPSASIWTALFAQAHFHRYGTTREQMAQIALNARRNAALNPAAVFKEPMTMDDYMGARIISTPLCLYDCDVPIDGAVAVIVSHVHSAKDLACPVVQVEAICGALHGNSGWDQFDDLTTMAARDAGRRLWARTSLTPADVDVAQLYDGFSFLTLSWLEALGFCAPGESGPFVEGGQRISLQGELPLNTGGGQLSAGRLHGFGHLYEAIVQLRGEAGARQVPGAKVAVVANGGGPLASCALLSRY
ncbi:thiolase family protein [Pseudomonas silvicola]|nr:thiolase family protein [Pseudomonas silvicola]